MWVRAIFSVTAGGYAGGVIASYAVLAVDGVSLQSPALRVYPFYFSLGIMFFTLPGAIMVAGIFDRLTHWGFGRLSAYPLTVGFGALAGSIVLGALWPTWLSLTLGGVYGAATATCWALFDGLSVSAPPRRADRSRMADSE